MSKKIVAIFGAGRMGLAISYELIKLGFAVDLYDVNDKPHIIQSDYLNFINLSKDSVEARSVFLQRARKHASDGQSYHSAFHTYLYTTQELESFIEIVNGEVQSMGTIGTILTFDRSVDRGILDENHPKLTESEIYKNGGYAAGKREIEIYLEKAKAKLDVPFFLPKTFHIIGNGFLPGITPPHFRDPGLVDQLLTGSIALPQQGNIIYQVIDKKVLARIIALGIKGQLDGEYIVLGEQLLTAAEYYTIAAEKVGIKNLIIENLELNQINDSYIMLLDWAVRLSRLKAALGIELIQRVSWEGSLEQSIRYAQSRPKEVGPSIKDKMNVSPMPVLPVQRYIFEARQEYNRSKAIY